MRAIGCVLRIYAKSELVGAAVHDHERLADQLLDRVEVALRKIVAQRRTLHQITSSKLLDEAALSLIGLEQWPGVVYELRFSVDRGVFDTAWDGEAKPGIAAEVAPLAGIASETIVRLQNGAGDEETACGG